MTASKDEFKKIIGSRLTWHSDAVAAGTWDEDERVHVGFDDPLMNIVGSATITGTHMPAIDIDHEVFVVESTNEGHNHLYINVEIPREQYLKLLEVMVECGLVQENVLKHAKERDDGSTFLRPPWIKKPKGAQNS